MKNRKVFKEFMVGLGLTFDKEVSEPLMEIYWNALKQFTDEQCRAAFNKSVVQCKFFPKPIELIELTGSGPGKIEDIAQVQADLVIKSIRQIGGYQSVDFRDPVTKSVITNCYGGWIKLCEEQLEADEKWLRKDFVKYYQAYRRQGIQTRGHLSGRHEAENLALGYMEHIPQIVHVEQKLLENKETKQIENNE